MTKQYSCVYTNAKGSGRINTDQPSIVRTWVKSALRVRPRPVIVLTDNATGERIDHVTF